MMANGMDWHNVPAAERKPRVTRNDCGQIVVVTTTHADGHRSVGLVERQHSRDCDSYNGQPCDCGLAALNNWRKGE